MPCLNHKVGEGGKLTIVDSGNKFDKNPEIWKENEKELKVVQHQRTGSKKRLHWIGTITAKCQVLGFDVLKAEDFF